MSIDPATDPHNALLRNLTPDACGIEIGAHQVPVAGVAPWYIDQAITFSGSAGRIDVQADAGALPIPDDELDYVCSSHVLEHLPNPLAALLEWRRVLRPGGFLYLIVPDKRLTFDAARALTTVDHLIHDFRRNTSGADEAHIRDFIFGCDWTQVKPPHGSPNRDEHCELYLRRAAAGKFVDIHYHTFTPSSLKALLRAFGFLGKPWPMFRRVAQYEPYPPDRGDGIGILLQKIGRDGDGRSRLTFAQTDGSSRRPSLKLVCPASLAPLTRLESTPTGAFLFPAVGDWRYAINEGIPALLCPRDVPMRRAWLQPARRLRLLLMSRLRRSWWYADDRIADDPPLAVPRGVAKSASSPSVS